MFIIDSGTDMPAAEAAACEAPFAHMEELCGLLVRGSVSSGRGSAGGYTRAYSGNEEGVGAAVTIHRYTDAREASPVRVAHSACAARPSTCGYPSARERVGAVRIVIPGVVPVVVFGQPVTLCLVVQLSPVGHDDALVRKGLR